MIDRVVGKRKTDSEDQEYFQTLKGHTLDALKILKNYVDKYNYVIKQFCERWDINYPQFVNSAFFTVYFHDIGKACYEFQKRIKKGKRSPNFPHPLYSWHITKHLSSPKLLDDPIERLAILSHHTQLHTNIYDTRRGAVKGCKYLRDYIKTFTEEATQVHKSLGFGDICPLQLIKMKELPDLSGIQLAQALREIQNYQRGFRKDTVRLKSIFSFLFALLQNSDDYSSAEFQVAVKESRIDAEYIEDVIKNPGEYVPKLYCENPMELVLKGHSAFPYQKQLYRECPKYSILFAPCGRGKTEAALLWSLQALEKFNRNKIIFALPTQVTSNAMWERLCELFGSGNDSVERFIKGKDYVGLFHGKSYLKQQEMTDTDEIGRKEVFEGNFKGNIFFKPITITTVDHLVYSSIHGFSQADFAFGNLQNAVVVFDEIHYYEKETLEHLVTFMKLLSDLTTPHLLMTGTLPNFLSEELKGINSYRKFKDEEGLSFSPFKLVTKETPLIKGNKVNREVISIILDNYKQNLNQTIILNTVERSKNIYKDLCKQLSERGNDNVILYHSRFTYSDRVKKEAEIEELRNSPHPFILIGTQVLEISLDISADMMYTELAPADALGQRAGRLNRGAKTYKNKIEHSLVVIPAQNHFPYNEDIYQKSLKEIKNFEKVCSYQDIKDFCDIVYTGIELRVPTQLYKSDNPSVLQTFFEKAVLFGPPYYKVASSDEKGKAFRLREANFQQVDVIPYRLFRKQGAKALKSENIVKVPFYLYRRDPQAFIQHKHNDRSYILCKYDYNYEIGFEIPELDSSSDFGEFI